MARKVDGRKGMSDPLIGKTISGCEILDVIGQGGMATVYRAHQISMNRDVALKVLPPEFMRQAVSLDRFKREASIVARLEHRAIVPVHDHGEYEGMPYMVMRLMDGGSVEEILVKGPIQPLRTLAILEQIAPALDYAHREGVLHRDLKPSNILLDANGDAYITDFGIARILGPHIDPLTTTGVVGTPSYMSPEQAQGHELDGRSDVYALGVVLFEMLTGVRPYEGETPYTVAVKHVTEAIPSACAINPRLSAAAEQVLYRALAKNREARFQSADMLVAALRSAVGEGQSVYAEALAETEPTLNEALKAGQERQATAYQLPANDGVLTSPPNVQMVPPYVSPPAQTSSYGSALRPVSRPRTASSWDGLPAWLTWAAVATLIGMLLVALSIGVIYFYSGAGDGGRSGSNTVESLDVGATAIFKLTATRAAIDTALAPLPVATSPGLTASAESAEPDSQTPTDALPTPVSSE